MSMRPRRPPFVTALPTQPLRYSPGGGHLHSHAASRASGLMNRRPLSLHRTFTFDREPCSTLADCRVGVCVWVKRCGSGKLPSSSLRAIISSADGKAPSGLCPRPSLRLLNGDSSGRSAIGASDSPARWRTCAITQLHPDALSVASTARFPQAPSFVHRLVRRCWDAASRFFGRSRWLAHAVARGASSDRRSRSCLRRTG